ncbi:7343_t:CDS:10 [Paraglomus occultum]|uniref:Telomerase reverse transcriptase n=1 Tax=Paraglomus occultum TaxID=144539 RepID=A0A9N9C4H8_9GLOM|nr:7343_t:CDS:10 [Paraglomus occultum]
MSLQPLTANLPSNVRSRLAWFKELEPLIGQLLKNRVLDTLCPKKNCMSYETPHKEVTNFLTMVLREVMPFEIWPQKKLRRYIRLLVRQPLSEKFSLHDVMTSFKKCRWIDAVYSRSGSKKQSWTRIDLLDIWLVRLSNHSYPRQQTALFFWHDTWSTLENGWIDRQSSSQFTEIRNKRSQCRGRLIPKTGGFRLISNYEEPTLYASLLNVKHILGSFNSQRINKSSLIDNINNFISCVGKNEEAFYIVKTDIKACFDSINHDALMELISDKLKEEFVTLFKFNFLSKHRDRVYNSFDKKRREDILETLRNHLVENIDIGGRQLRAPTASNDNMQSPVLSTSPASPALSPSAPTITSSPTFQPLPELSPQPSIIPLTYAAISVNMSDTRLAICRLLSIDNQQMHITIRNRSCIIDDLLNWTGSVRIEDMLSTPVISLQNEHALDIGGVLRDIVESFWEQIKERKFPIIGLLFTNSTLTHKMRAALAQETVLTGFLGFYGGVRVYFRTPMDKDSPQEIANFIRLSAVILPRRCTLEKFKEGFDVDFGHGAREIQVLREPGYVHLRGYLYQELENNVRLIAQFDWTARAIENETIPLWFHEYLTNVQTNNCERK